MEGPETPPFFICPISLQIMEDPVTICTGMTYDRESIRQWLFVYNKSTCPVTKQVITDHSFTPNSTLLRLINSWRAANAAAGKIRASDAVERIDTGSTQKLIEEVKNSGTPLKAIKELKSLVKKNDSSKRMMEDAGLVQLLSTIVIKNYPQLNVVVANEFGHEIAGSEEALVLLSLLPMTAATATDLASMDFIPCLSWVLQRGSYNARLHSVTILKSICREVPESFFTDLKAELFDGLVEILKDQNSNHATMSALLILMEVCSCGKNRVKAIEGGTVPVIVEILAENNEKRKCTEVMLGVLELLCGRAEGRAAFLAHPASVAAVTRKIFKVSDAANEKAVKILSLVCKHSSSSYLIQEMADVGAVLKLCMVLQTVGNSNTRDRAKEILCLHWKTWKASPCVPLQGWFSGLDVVGEKKC